MLYNIRLKITYDYQNTASSSRHVIRLLPADLPNEQRLVAGTTTVKPKPAEWINRVDFFGNKCVETAFHKDHKVIVFSTEARLNRFTIGYDRERSAVFSNLPRNIIEVRDLTARSPLHFISASSLVPLNGETAAYAQQKIIGNPPVFDLVCAIGQAIHDEFSFDPKATTVETPMRDAFIGRHGVCQDFAHIMISCLRGIGIPAGYVSGFLRTIPPKGKPRLEGADATHAWVSAWCGPDLGWIEYDPTNGTLVSNNHIVIARGRDYFDVAPVKGVVRTFGRHETKQSVDVIPIEN